MAKKSVKESAKRIVKITLLLAVKEGYLLARNLLGLICHPFLTLRIIKKERDLSQVLLISSVILIPITTVFLATMAILFLTKVLYLPLPPMLGSLVLFADLFTLLFFSLAVFYLFYWSFQVIKKNHFNFFREHDRKS